MASGEISPPAASIVVSRRIGAAETPAPVKRNDVMTADPRAKIHQRTDPRRGTIRNTRTQLPIGIPALLGATAAPIRNVVRHATFYPLPIRP